MKQRYIFSGLDILSLDKENQPDAQRTDQMEMNEVESQQDEAEEFLGIDPSVQQPPEISLRKEVADRIKFWCNKGIADKEEKLRLLAQIPRKGQLNLEAPVLNEEITADLLPRALAKDEHFRDYQNITGAALSSSSSVLSMILNDSQEPLDRQTLLTNLSNTVKLLSDLFFNLTQARKAFLVGRYDEKVQRILKTAQPTEWLFGDNLKTTLENAKALERITKELRFKPRPPLRAGNAALNWKSSTARREGVQSSYKSSPAKFNRSATNNGYNRQRPYPTKKFYAQSQPQRHPRR